MRLLSPPFAVALLLVSCGGDAGPGPERTPTPLDHSTTGTIAGVVRFDGAVPPATPIPGTPECAAQRHAPLVAADLVVHDGRLENAFVYLKEGLGDRVFATPPQAVTIDQQGCTYEPRVAGAQTGQPITFLNSDPLLHNIHGMPRESPAWNFSLAVKGSQRTIRIAHPEVAIGLRCDVHPWMQGYLGVLDHPYFAVTGADGAFTLSDVPPGDYLLAVWHERLGTRDARVHLAPRGQEQVTFTFAPK